MNCTYQFKINGKVIEFNSEEELGSFITNNKHRLKLGVNSKVSYSKELNKQDEMLARLMKIHEDSENVVVKYNESGEKIISHNDYISVTKAITDPDFVGSDRKALVTGFNMDGYFEKLTEQLSKEGKNADEIKKHLNDLKSNWESLAKMGTAIHKITEIAFGNLDYGGNEIIKLFKKSKEYKEVGFRDEDLQIALEYVTNIKRQLMTNFPDAKFLPEFKIRTTEGSHKKVVGKIDLLVIDKEGNVHIYDFKASPKGYNDFKQVKQITFEYQLAFYRQMLAQHGLNVSKTQLGILPIQFKNIDYDVKTYQDLSTEGRIENISLGNPSKYYIIENLQDLMPAKEISYESSTEDYERLNTLSNEIFGYKLEEKGQRKSNGNGYKQGSDGSWWFKDLYTGKIYKKDTESKIKEEYDKYIERNDKSKLYYAQDVANEFNIAKNNDYDSFDISSNKSKKYNQYFGKYLREGWSLNSSLLGMGVMMFTHPTYKLVDFVYVNNEDISKPVKNMAFGKNGQKITGNLIRDNFADADTLDANVGNIELMRLMFAANEVMPQFKDYQVHEFKVVNNSGAKMAFQNTDLLVKNFNQLVGLAKKHKPDLKIENNFQKIDGGKKLIEVVPAETRLLNAVDEILNRNTQNVEKGLKQHRSRIAKLSSLDQAQKLQELIEISKHIKELVIGSSEYSADKILDPLKDMEHNRLNALYYVVHDAIREVGNLYFEYQFKDIKKWSAHSEVFSPAQLSAVKVINEVQKKIIDKARNKSMKEMNQQFTETKVYSEKFLKDVNAIDASLNVFDHLIISEQNGEDFIFSVKNPYQDMMSAHDKEFLTNWLKTINSNRFPTTKGDHTSAEAKELIESGEWFEIPVTRGGMYNRGVKGIVSNIKDLMDRITNLEEYLDEQSEERKNKQLDRFESYINPIRISGEPRLGIIRHYGLNYFSRNLSEIALEYQYHSILEKNYNDALPFIRTGLICANAVNLFTKAEMDDAMKIMYEKYQSGFYNIDHIPENLKPAYKGYMVLSNLATMFSIAWNPVSFVRESFTGRYNNYGRILSKFAGKDMPSESDLLKAYAVTDAYGLEALVKQNKMNAINMRWNIGGRAMQEMKESHRAQRNAFLGFLTKSGPAHTLGQIPDYQHRMALFIAYMYKDGCYDAYSYDEQNQTLIYDFKKDERFKCLEEYIKTGKASSEDLENISKYNMMREEFNKDLPSGEKLKFGDPLPEGMTESKVKTIKNISNQIHGNMDKDTSMHVNRYFLGKILLKFQTFVSAKALNYTLTPGKYQLMEERYAYDEATGLPLYLKMVKDPETGEITMEETTDLNDPMCTKQRVLRMQERQEAGALYAIRDVIEILKNPENRSSQWEEFLKDESKVAGLKFMIGDLFMLLIAAILASAMGMDSLKSKEPFSAAMLEAALIRPAQENNMFTLSSGILNVIDPVAFSINGRVLNNTISFITNDNEESKDYLYKTFGFGKFLGMF